jgi:hypothetical protein
VILEFCHILIKKRILPHATGRIDIKLNVDIPVDTELVEPLQEGSIWCQARGAATEVSGL